MKLFLIPLLFVGCLACAQSVPDKTKPDLTKLSIEQLHACLLDETTCETQDQAAIAGELAGRLPQFSRNQLLSCFADWKICGADEWAISEELRKRRHTSLLIARYHEEPNSLIRYGILLTLYNIRSAEVVSLMREVLAGGKGDEDDLFWPASYLAKDCDSAALKWLSSRKGRVEGCMFYIGTISSFGKCQYRSAIPYLVEYSINDACLNVVDEAENDLSKFYPHSPKHFDNIEAMQKYFCKRAKQDGFKVKCDE